MLGALTLVALTLLGVTGIVLTQFYDPAPLGAHESVRYVITSLPLVSLVRDVITAHGDAVAQYRAGKTATFGFLVGQVMKGSGGKANPKLANQLLKRELDRT